MKAAVILGYKYIHTVEKVEDNKVLSKEMISFTYIC